MTDDLVQVGWAIKWRVSDVEYWDLRRMDPEPYAPHVPVFVRREDAERPGVSQEP